MGFLRRAGLLTLMVLVSQVARGQTVEDGFRAYQSEEYAVAFQILSASGADNPAVQNLLGLMLYQGLGTSPDAVAARHMFRRAAEQGVADAYLNLGILHAVGADGIDPDPASARTWFERASNTPAAPPDPAAQFGIDTVIAVAASGGKAGKRTFQMFCAGCHGFNGMSIFEAAPSFAMGERMTRSDSELLRSILKGKGLMPSWEDKLPVAELTGALAYLRMLMLITGYGTITERYNVAPELYFVFTPAGMLETP